MKLSTQRGTKWAYTFPIRFLSNWKRCGAWHAHAFNAPVLKTDASWRTLAGVYVRCGRRVFVLQWRCFDDE